MTPVSVLLEAACRGSNRGEDTAAASWLEAPLRRSPDDALLVEVLRHARASGARRRAGRPARARGARRRRWTGPRERARRARLAARGTPRRPRGRRERLRTRLAIDPRMPVVATALERLHRKAERWDALRRVLEHAAVAARSAARRVRVCARRSAGGAFRVAGRGGARLRSGAGARAARPGGPPRPAPARRGSRRRRRAAAHHRERGRRHPGSRAPRGARERAGAGLRAGRSPRACARVGPALVRERSREHRCARRLRAPARGARPRPGAGGVPRAPGAAAAGSRARRESPAARAAPRLAWPRGRQHPLPRVRARIRHRRSRGADGPRRAVRARGAQRGPRPRAALARRARAARAAPSTSLLWLACSKNRSATSPARSTRWRSSPPATERSPMRRCASRSCSSAADAMPSSSHTCARM